jgi:hypothetical protein
VDGRAPRWRQRTAMRHMAIYAGNGWSTCLRREAAEPRRNGTEMMAREATTWSSSTCVRLRCHGPTVSGDPRDRLRGRHAGGSCTAAELGQVCWVLEWSVNSARGVRAWCAHHAWTRPRRRISGELICWCLRVIAICILARWGSVQNRRQLDAF